jgi:hypothetical protein
MSAIGALIDFGDPVIEPHSGADTRKSKSQPRSAARRLDLLVNEADLAARRALFRPPDPPPRGYSRLHAVHVLQAAARGGIAHRRHHGARRDG